MAYIIGLSVGAVLGIFGAVLMVSLAPGFTTMLLQGCHVYPPARLTYRSETYAADFNRTSVIDVYAMPEGGFRSENARVAGWMLLFGLITVTPIGGLIGAVYTLVV